MYNEIFVILFLLFVKHWYVDFVNQTAEEVKSKGIYSDSLGIQHSLKHGIGTFLVFLVFDFPVSGAVLLGMVDFILHYHTDWAKSNINKSSNLTPADKKFWTWLGLDQLVHAMTYLLLVWIAT